MTQDAVTVAPNNYKSLFENDRVRLLEYRGKPGDKTEMHYDPDVLAYPLTGGKFRFTVPGDQSFEIDVNAAEPVFMEAGDHATENLGGDAHFLLIELK